MHGKPLTTRPIEGDGGGVGRWWRRQSDEVLRPLKLRPQYLTPIGSWSNASRGGESLRHPPAKQLASRRGIAFRLHLVALYEMQLSNFVTRHWVAEPLYKRSAWHDEILDNRLERPSWASLTLGYERPPLDDGYSAWRRSRTEAVANGFARLRDLELLDGESRILLSDGRPWRRMTVDSRTYHAIGRTEPCFEVPPSLFTSGAYLKLSGVGLHALLVLICQHTRCFNESMISRYGITRAALEKGRAELAETGRLPDDLLAIVTASSAC